MTIVPAVILERGKALRLAMVEDVRVPVITAATSATAEMRKQFLHSNVQERRMYEASL